MKKPIRTSVRVYPMWNQRMRSVTRFAQSDIAMSEGGGRMYFG